MDRSRYFFLTLLSSTFLLHANGAGFIDTLELPDDSAPLTITRHTTPCDVLQTVISQAHLNRILANDLYTYTYPLSMRNILTCPSLYTPTPPDSQCNWNIFYQQMPTIFPFPNGPQGYLNVLTDDYLHNLDIEIARLCNINVPEAIGLLKKAVVAQYKVGFMFDFWKRIKWFSLGIQFPFYAVARHYNLPIEDQQDLRTQIPIITRQFTTIDTDALPANQSTLYPYLVETRLGLGDTRLSFCFHVIEKNRADLILGAKCTFPTSATLTSGLIGSDFSKCIQRKSIDIYTLAEQFMGDCTEKKKAIETARQFGLAAMYQMNDTLLGTRLGDGRTQLALYAQPTLRVDNQVSLIAYLTANWLLAHKTTRFIKETVDAADFADSNFDSTHMTENQCAAALTFLSTRFENAIMPAQYCVYLRPQFEFQCTAESQIQLTDNWRFFVGYDYWSRQTECTNTVTDCQCRSIPCNTLQISSALVPFLSQQKLFIRAEYTKFKISHNFIFSLGADFPLTNNNIGGDFTGFVRFDWEL